MNEQLTSEINPPITDQTSRRFYWKPVGLSSLAVATGGVAREAMAAAMEKGLAGLLAGIGGEGYDTLRYSRAEHLEVNTLPAIDNSEIPIAAGLAAASILYEGLRPHGNDWVEGLATAWGAVGTLALSQVPGIVIHMIDIISNGNAHLIDNVPGAIAAITLASAGARLLQMGIGISTLYSRRQRAQNRPTPNVRVTLPSPYSIAHHPEDLEVPRTRADARKHVLDRRAKRAERTAHVENTIFPQRAEIIVDGLAQPIDNLSIRHRKLIKSIFSQPHGEESESN